MAISLAQTPPRHQLHTNKHEDTQSLMCTRLRVIRNSAVMTLDSVTPVLSLNAQNAFQTVFLAILGSQGFKNSAREGFQTRTILVHEYPHGNGRKVDMGERGKGFLTAWSWDQNSGALCRSGPQSHLQREITRLAEQPKTLQTSILLPPSLCISFPLPLSLPYFLPPSFLSQNVGNKLEMMLTGKENWGNGLKDSSPVLFNHGSQFPVLHKHLFISGIWTSSRGQEHHYIRR